MTEPTRTRRGFFRVLTGETEPEKPPGSAPESKPVFSLSRFYAARKEAGEATGEALPELEVTETAAFGTTPVGTPELGARKRQP